MSHKHNKQSQSLPEVKVSDHVIVQCFALRNANIWNAKFHLRQF